MKTASKKEIKLSFKPKLVTKKLISVLPERGKDIIIRRYGLGPETKRMTLDAIGKRYGITRERVRQIENYSLDTIRKSKEYKEEEKVFTDLEDLLHSFGGVVSEEGFLEAVSKDKSAQNHVHFLLVVGHSFVREKEDDEFKHRWHVDKKLADKIYDSLRKVYSNLSDEDIIPESDMIKSFLNHVKDVSDKYKDEEIIKRWLSLSKNIDKNPLGEWGKADSTNIKAKGIRDYAFLVIRRHGSPIHFREVAEQIEKVFNKKAHVATTHNELIKDPRFVLVGRGLYALVDWGYESGVVKDIIKKIIEKEGPLTKEEVVQKVLKERYVKENTVLVNLQNPKYFKKNKDGKYVVA